MEKNYHIQGIALCRCGSSKNKPFCDGTHSLIGFISIVKNNKNLITSNKKSYPGKNITIHDNRRICSHAAECVKNLPLAFRLNQRPWIDSDQEKNIEKIIQTIKLCPSGALSYSIHGNEYRDYNVNPLVKVGKDGPYQIRGGIELMSRESQLPNDASKEHYSLCRCGESSNKPFCDGTHTTINFKDDKTDINTDTIT